MQTDCLSQKTEKPSLRGRRQVPTLVLEQKKDGIVRCGSCVDGVKVKGNFFLLIIDMCEGKTKIQTS